MTGTGFGAAIAVGALGCAVYSWPAKVSARRLGALSPADRVRRAACPVRLLALPRPGRGALTVLGGVLGLLCAGPAGGAAAAVAVAVGAGRVRAARAARRRSSAVVGLLDAVDALVGELRAGAHPSVAAGLVNSVDGEVYRVFEAITATARLGGDLPDRLRTLAVGHLHLRPELERIAAAWSLADRYGIALADLLDAARRDLDLRRRFAGRVRAQLAGPRATIAVLAGLPLFGLVLGQGIGAAPWHVLTGTGTGQLLLLVGVGLIGAGLAWSARIVAGAVPR